MSNFLVNTEIEEDKDPSCSLRVAAYAATADQDSLASAAAHCSEDPDSSSVLRVEYPDLNPDSVVGLIPAEFLVANDYLKVAEALANFVLRDRKEKNKKKKKQTKIIIGNKNKLLLYRCPRSLSSSYLTSS